MSIWLIHCGSGPHREALLHRNDIYRRLQLPIAVDKRSRVDAESRDLCRPLESDRSIGVGEYDLVGQYLCRAQRVFVGCHDDHTT